MLRAVVLIVAVAGCGRVSFGYPVVPCDEVVGTDTALDPNNDHCYARFAGPTSGGQAVDACSELGGYLTTIASPDEQATIVGLGVGSGARIGLWNSGPGNPSFSWYMPEAFGYSNWAPGQPVICAGSTSSASIDASGLWTAQCIGDGLPFVCEFDPWLVRSDGHAYRVRRGSQSWPTAIANCEAMGAHLATITSSDELTFVAGLVNSNMWLGGSWSVTMGSSWITGEPFDFAAWRPLKPDGTTDGCIGIAPDESWEDLPCTTALNAALCERDE